MRAANILFWYSDIAIFLYLCVWKDSIYELVNTPIATEIDKGSKNHPDMLFVLFIVPWVEKAFDVRNV